jgi:hypothetical protein
MLLAIIDYHSAALLPPSLPLSLYYKSSVKFIIFVKGVYLCPFIRFNRIHIDLADNKKAIDKDQHRDYSSKQAFI